MGPRRWYSCKQCGQKRPETDFRVIHGTREKHCKRCKGANQNRARALARAKAVVPWPVIVRQYALTPEEHDAVERAAGLFWGRDEGEPTPDMVLQEVARDLTRQIELAGAVCWRVRELRDA
jgi:hypothetical protein